MKIKQEIARTELDRYDVQRKKYADSKYGKHTKLFVGDIVKYWHGPYPAKGSDKLITHWNGPYIILSVFNKGTNYLLQHVEYESIYFIANIAKISKYNLSEEEKKKYANLSNPKMMKRNLKAIKSEIQSESKEEPLPPVHDDNKDDVHHQLSLQHPTNHLDSNQRDRLDAKGNASDSPSYINHNVYMRLIENDVTNPYITRYRDRKPITPTFNSQRRLKIYLRADHYYPVLYE